MIKGLSVAYIYSAHGEKLAEWYSKTLGLTVGASITGWTEFQMASGSRFAVDRTSFSKSVVEKQAIMLNFVVEDIQKEVKDLAVRGVKFYPSEKETLFDVGPSLVATFEEPDGNRFQLNQSEQLNPMPA